MLLDADRLEEIVDGLGDAARAAVTKVAFTRVGMWSGGRQVSLGPDTLLALEQHGLVFCHRLPWGGADAWVAAEDLLPGLQRARGRAHAARIPESPRPADSVGVPEQILHDVAVVGAAIAAGGVRLKADGELYARSRPPLLAALAELPHLGSEETGDVRLSQAFELLQQSGALRVLSDEIPGRAPRRELRLARDLVELLHGSTQERSSLLDAHLCLDPEDRLCAPLLDALCGRTVTVAALGEAVWALVREAGYTLPLPAGVTEMAGSLALRRRWLRGDVLLGESPGGRLTVTFSPAVAPAPDGPLCVAQGDFELVLLRPARPHERAALLLLGETEPGREHVVRLTRERTLSATAALRALRPGGTGADAEPFLALLRSLAGELPPNVERTVADWIARAPRPARLRSAIFVEVEAALGDAAAGALGALAVARLGPGLLAVPADRLAEVEKVLRKAGLALESGLDRVSGRWSEDRSRYEETDDWWRPIPREEGARVSPGPLRSGLADLAARIPAAEPTERAAARQRISALEVADREDEQDGEADDPGETIFEAWESGEPIELRYAGASGMSSELVRVLELDGARFRVRDLRSGGEHWRWVRGVLAAHLPD